jgi:hypothetical protein
MEVTPGTLKSKSGSIVAKLAHEGQVDAAHAAVHVKEQVLLLRKRANLSDRVDHTLRVARR